MNGENREAENRNAEAETNYEGPDAEGNEDGKCGERRRKNGECGLVRVERPPHQERPGRVAGYPPPVEKTLGAPLTGRVRL